MDSSFWYTIRNLVFWIYFPYPRLTFRVEGCKVEEEAHSTAFKVGGVQGSFPFTLLTRAIFSCVTVLEELSRCCFAQNRTKHSDRDRDKDRENTAL